jgi:hypothetical protein
MAGGTLCELLGEIIEIANALRQHVGEYGMLQDEVWKRCGKEINGAHALLNAAKVKEAVAGWRESK